MTFKVGTERNVAGLVLKLALSLSFFGSVTYSQQTSAANKRGRKKERKKERKRTMPYLLLLSEPRSQTTLRIEASLWEGEKNVLLADWHGVRETKRKSFVCNGCARTLLY